VTGQDDSRLHTAVLVGPEGERRRARKARRQAAAKVETDARQHRKAQARAKWEAERPNAATPPTCPPPANRGPRRCGRRAGSGSRKHQDTSATLAGAVPVPGRRPASAADGVFIGQDLYSRRIVRLRPLDPLRAGVITAPNIVLAGIVGSGKSSLAKSLYTRSDAVRTQGLRPRRP
jgi:hypothetical protein